MTEQGSFPKFHLLLISASLQLYRNASLVSAALDGSFSDSLDRQLHASAEGETMIAGLNRWLFQKRCDEFHFSDTEAPPPPLFLRTCSRAN